MSFSNCFVPVTVDDSTCHLQLFSLAVLFTAAPAHLYIRFLSGSVNQGLRYAVQFLFICCHFLKTAGSHWQSDNVYRAICNLIFKRDFFYFHSSMTELFNQICGCIEIVVRFLVKFFCGVT